MKRPDPQFWILFLTLALGLPAPAFALRPTGLEEEDHPVLRQLQAALAPSATGLEERKHRKIFKEKLPSYRDRKEIRVWYSGFREKVLNPHLAEQLTPGARRRFFDRRFGPQTALLEAVYNAVLHGKGGTLEIDRLAEGGLVARVKDRGQGLADPNEALRKSYEAHEGARRRQKNTSSEDPSSGKSNFGFRNMARYAGQLRIDSLGKRWVLEDKPWEVDGITIPRTFVAKGVSPVSSGTLVTLGFPSFLSAGLEELPDPALLRRLADAASKGRSLGSGYFTRVYPFPGRDDLVVKIPKPAYRVIPRVLFSMGKERWRSRESMRGVWAEARRVSRKRQIESYRLAEQRGRGVVAPFRLYELPEDHRLPYLIVQKRAKQLVGEELRRLVAQKDAEGAAKVLAQNLKLRWIALTQGFWEVVDNFTVNSGYVEEDGRPVQMILDAGALMGGRPSKEQMVRVEQWSLKQDLPTISSQLAAWYRDQVEEWFGKMSPEQLNLFWNLSGGLPIKFPEADEAIRHFAPTPTSLEEPEADSSEVQGKAPVAVREKGVLGGDRRRLGEAIRKGLPEDHQARPLLEASVGPGWPAVLERVVAGFYRVPRSFFLPLKSRIPSYADKPIPIGQKQTTSQPQLVALMLTLLDLKEGDKVLEVGSGSGYVGAWMATLVDTVVAVERNRQLATDSKRALERLGIKNVQVIEADGTLAHPEIGPVDAILVSAASEGLPVELIRKLKVGGRMVIPIPSRQLEMEHPTHPDNLTFLTKVIRDGRVRLRFSRPERYPLPTTFVPLMGKGRLLPWPPPLRADAASGAGLGEVTLEDLVANAASIPTATGLEERPLVRAVRLAKDYFVAVERLYDTQEEWIKTGVKFLYGKPLQAPLNPTQRDVVKKLGDKHRKATLALEGIEGRYHSEEGLDLIKGQAPELSERMEALTEQFLMLRNQLDETLESSPQDQEILAVALRKVQKVREALKTLLRTLDGWLSQHRGPSSAGLEEPSLVKAEGLLRGTGLFDSILDVEVARRNAFIVTEEALVGELGRPGLGLYVRELWKRNPGLSITVVTHDEEAIARLARAYGIPPDQLVSPNWRQGELYEEAVNRVMEQYQAGWQSVHLIHTDSLDLRLLGSEVDRILLPRGMEAWLEALDRFLQLLGMKLPADGLAVNHYQAADLATQL